MCWYFGTEDWFWIEIVLFPHTLGYFQRDDISWESNWCHIIYNATKYDLSSFPRVFLHKSHKNLPRYLCILDPWMLACILRALIIIVIHWPQYLCIAYTRGQRFGDHCWKSNYSQLLDLFLRGKNSCIHEPHQFWCNLHSWLRNWKLWEIQSWIRAYLRFPISLQEVQKLPWLQTPEATFSSSSYQTRPLGEKKHSSNSAKTQLLFKLPCNLSIFQGLDITESVWSFPAKRLLSTCFK